MSHTVSRLGFSQLTGSARACSINLPVESYEAGSLTPRILLVPFVMTRRRRESMSSNCRLRFSFHRSGLNSQRLISTYLPAKFY